MFCSECGAKASGKFCWQCGSKIVAGGAAPSGGGPVVEKDEEPLEVIYEDGPVDWTDEIRYDRLLAIPEIRERIAASGKGFRPGVSGEQFLALFDALVPTGVSLEKLCVALQPISGSLGFKTGKSESRTFAVPAGRLLVATLCRLAAQGLALKKVDQASNGCTLRATIPSSLWSLSGEMVVSVERGHGISILAATTDVAGQLFDWGHSQRLLNGLFDGVAQELGATPRSRAA